LIFNSILAPQNPSFALQNALKIHSKSIQMFIAFFLSILGSFWEAFSSILSYFFKWFFGSWLKRPYRPCQSNQGSGPLPKPPKVIKKSIKKSIFFCMIF